MRIFKPSYANLCHLVIATTFALQPAVAKADERENHTRAVRDANRLLDGYYADEVRPLRRHLSERGTSTGPNEHFDMFLPVGRARTAMPTQTSEEMRRDRETYELSMDYYGHQGNERYIGTFVESGAPFSDGYQWNTQRWAGLAVPSLRRKALDKAREAGIRNIRIGVNIQDIDLSKPDSAHSIVEFCQDAWARGISPTLAILFFPSLKKWERTNPDRTIDAYRSYLLNPAFPKDAGKLAEFILTKVKQASDQFNRENGAAIASQALPRARIAVNPINEAETLAGFTGQFWHGALAKWNDPNAMRSYVPSTINIALASLEIRSAILRVYQDERVLLFENPAMTTTNYPSHHGDLQMAVNKFILGHNEVAKADYQKLRSEPLESIRLRFEEAKARGIVNVVEASILKYVFIPSNDTPFKRERARGYIVGQLERLYHAHRRFETSTKRTAKTDTILMVDYYQQSEFVLPRPVPELVRDLSANQGAMLKAILAVNSDQSFLDVLRTRAIEAERFTGIKIWKDYQSATDINFVDFLTLEDSIMLEKLIGLRNEWSLRGDALFAERRQRARFKLESLDASDEKRLDAFLNQLLEQNAALLKHALQTEDLSTVVGNGDLRTVLNANGRETLHRLFGLERNRAVGFLPPHYARQIRSEIRRGFYETFAKYVGELGIRVGGIGEMGTPYYPYGATVMKQMMLELIRASRDIGFFIVRVDAGPMIGTVGWLGGPIIKTLKENGKRASDGLLKLVRKSERQFEYELSSWPGSRPFFEEFKVGFTHGLERQQNKPPRAPRLIGRTCEDLFRSAR